MQQASENKGGVRAGAFGLGFHNYSSKERVGPRPLTSSVCLWHDAVCRRSLRPRCPSSMPKRSPELPALAPNNTGLLTSKTKWP